MSEPDKWEKLLDVYKQRPKLTVFGAFILLCIILGGLAYKHYTAKPNAGDTYQINSSGDHNQVTGANSGAINQTNK
jgi:hypothetical protein